MKEAQQRPAFRRPPRPRPAAAAGGYGRINRSLTQQTRDSRSCATIPLQDQGPAPEPQKKRRTNKEVIREILEAGRLEFLRGAQQAKTMSGPGMQTRPAEKGKAACRSDKSFMFRGGNTVWCLGGTSGELNHSQSQNKPAATGGEGVRNAMRYRSASRIENTVASNAQQQETYARFQEYRRLRSCKSSIIAPTGEQICPAEMKPTPALKAMHAKVRRISVIKRRGGFQRSLTQLVGESKSGAESKACL